MRLRTGLSVLAAAFFISMASAQEALPNIPNFHRVNDLVFRGAQPSADAWSSLAKLGVTTVIDLRRTDEHSTTDEAKAVTAAGMKYLNFPMKGVVTPDSAQIQQILKVMHSGEHVFVHCKRGADRTGAVVALYRITHDKWGSKQALNEAKSLGMSWTQVGLKRYVKSYQPNTIEASITPATTGM